MGRNSFIISIIIIIIGYGVTRAQPRWVKKVPIDKNYYIGVGSAAKQTGSTSHIDQARDAALGQIAASIAVSIANETSQSLLEQAGVVNETFQSNIVSLAKADLEGYELLKKWESNQEYWVYFRLSKEEYRKTLNRKKQISASQAFDFFTQGERAFETGQLSLALNLYAQAAKAIGGFHGMGLVVPGSNTESFVDVDVSVKLKSFLSSIQIQCSPNFIDAKLFESLEQPIRISATFMDDKGFHKPLTNLPLAIELIQGSISHQQVQTTDDQGNTSLRVNKVQTTGNIQVRVTPDLERLVGIDEDVLSSHLFSTLSLPYKIISIKVLPVRAFIESDEKNLGNISQRSIVTGKVKQFLTTAGWEITKDKNQADFFVNISAATSQGIERQGVHTAFATGHIAILRCENNEEFLRRNINKLNGGGLTFIAAGEQALEKLADALIQELEIELQRK
jgi:hypothetical protein